MATVKELLTNLGDNTRKFLGTSDTLSLEEMSVGIGKASDESDFQTELIEEFSNILDRSAAPDSYANGKEDGYADALAKRTDLIITENGEYTPTDGSTGFKSVTVDVVGGAFDTLIEGTITEVNSKAKNVRPYAFYKIDTLTSADMPNAISLGNYAFDHCLELKRVNFPNATSAGERAFNACYKLTSAALPNLENVGTEAFSSCQELTSVNVPKVKTIGNYGFSDCRVLSSIDLPSCTSIAMLGFFNCYSLKTVILRSTTVCQLKSKTGFNGCCHILGTVDATYNPNGDKDGYFYVPRAKVESYRGATNWSTYESDRFRALEDYTVDGTITGDLDPTKI